MKQDIPLVSIGFDGYELEAVLQGLAKTRSKSIILCCIDGFTKHVIPEEMSEEEWQAGKDLVEKYGLSYYGLFGHCNLSDPADLEKLKKRIRYTRFMGGDYIDTNAGPEGQEKGFFENLPQIVELAEELDVLVCLETHGDMLISGREAVKVFDKVKSEHVRVSYDPANVYFYTRGAVDPIEDVKHVYDHIGMLHFKGARSSADGKKWGFPPASEAAFDYDRFFKFLESKNYSGRIAVELEGRFRFEEEQGFVIDPIWPEDKIVKLYNDEIAYLQHKLSWMG
jgi:sugar phosphate isomerase/epimerase